MRFEIPIHGPVDGIIQLSIELYENIRLQDAAKAIVKSLLEKIQSVVDRPEIAARLEDYCIFHFSRIQPDLSPAELLKSHISSDDMSVESRVRQPSDREVQEILNDRISDGSSDVTLMSWYAAVIYGENAEDIYTVLRIYESRPRWSCSFL